MNESLDVVESLLSQNTRNLLRLTRRVNEKEGRTPRERVSAGADIAASRGCCVDVASTRADGDAMRERFELSLESADECRSVDSVRRYGRSSEDANKRAAAKCFVNFRKSRLISLLDRCFEFDSDLSASEAASAFCFSARNDVADVARSRATDLYRDCLIEYVEANARGSDVALVVKMITFCAEIERRTRTRSARAARERRWDWRTTFLPLVPDVRRWVEKQTSGENCAELVENLSNLARASTDELEPIGRTVRAALDRHSSDFARRSLLASQQNGKKIETLYALLDSVACFSKIPCGARAECLQLASALLDQIVFLRECTLANGIFHDAESHDWQNDKPFFEGEKVSFAIQMWILHMRALRSEMSARSPPYGRRIFAGVLRFSLSWFAQRYGRARPSRARIPQFEADVAAILENATEFAVSVDDEADDDADADAAFINRHLASLRSTLPNGSGGTRSRPDSTETGLLSVRYRFAPHWPTVVELLVIDDGALAVAVIERASEDTTRAILDALVACHAFPHCLGSTVVQLVKRDDRWAELLRSARREPTPNWIRPLDDLLERHCAPIVAPIISKVLRHESLKLFDGCASKPDDVDELASIARDQLLDRSLSAFATLPRTMQLLFARLREELPSSERNRLVVPESVYLHMVATKCCRLLPPCTFTHLLLESERSFINLERRLDTVRTGHDHGHDDDYTDYIVAATQMTSDSGYALSVFHRYLLENWSQLMQIKDRQL